jgi:hypothetical protein
MKRAKSPRARTINEIKPTVMGEDLQRNSSKNDWNGVSENWKRPNSIHSVNDDNDGNT